MSFCSACGSQQQQAAAYCPRCGNTLTPPKSFSAEAFISRNILFLKRLLSKVVEALKYGPGRFRRVASVALASFTSNFKKSKSSLRLAFKNNPTRFLILAVVGVYTLLGASSLVWATPQAFAHNYVDAISAKNVSALSNEAYFPNPGKAKLPPASFLAALSTKSGEYAVEADWLPWSSEVSIAVVWQDGREEQFKISARPGLLGLFLIREWAMVEPASLIKADLNPMALSEQPISIGGSQFVGSQDPKLAALLGKTYLMFPGDLTVTYENFGFAAADSESIVVPFKTATVSLGLGPKYDRAPIEAEFAGRNSVVKVMERCAAAKCSKLPYFLDWDFTWDRSGREYETSYDRKTTTTTYTVRDCVVSSIKAYSAVSADLSFECDISASRLELYATYYYYFQDDFEFYTGSGSQKKIVTARMSFEPKTQQFSITELEY
jgi:hypothetical protein